MSETPYPCSPQEPRRQRTRAALLLAGQSLLAERSIDAIAINEIVEAAGVAKGSFFNHFADKNAFSAAIAADIREDIERRVTAANDGIGDPAVRVARAMCGYIQFALVDARRARIMVRNHEAATSGEHPLNRGILADVSLGVATRRFAPRAKAAGVAFLIGVCQTALTSLLERRTTLAVARQLARDLLVLAFAGLGVEEAEARRILEEVVASTVTGKTARRPA